MKTLSYSLKIDYQLVIEPKNSYLSFSEFLTSKKELVGLKHAKIARKTPKEHYYNMETKPEYPMIILSPRNVLANLRCIAYSQKMCEQFTKNNRIIASVTEECRDSKVRPYHALRYNNDGKYEISEFQPEESLNNSGSALDNINWLITGIPVLWDEDEDLFDRMITEASDHSHIWQLPRGNHPKASDETRKQWEKLQKLFIDHLKCDRDETASALKAKANEYGLEREEEYLHNVWGIGTNGELIIVIAHGRLEDVGNKAKELGATRAICVENSGSCAVYLLKEEKQWLRMLCAPNFRPAGTSFVFFELNGADFSVIQF